MANINYDLNGKLNIKGIDIYYEYYGKRDCPVLVFQNGITMETTSWYQFLPALLEKVDVLLWDFRGQGQSESDDNLYSIEDFADYLKAIIEELDLNPQYVNLVGASFGSLVVVDFLKRYPQLANKAAITGAVLSNEKYYFYEAELAKKLLEKGLMEIWVDSLFSSMFSDNFLRSIESFIPKMKQVFYERYENKRKALYRLIEAEEEYISKVEDTYSDLKKIKTPLLLVSGAHDRITPPFVQKKALELFPDIKHIEYPDCGHIAFSERPKEFFGQLIDFFSR